MLCTFKSLLYICNTEINQQRTGANVGKTLKNTIMETLELKSKLNAMFKKSLLEMYREKVVNDNLYNLEEVEDFCKDYASATAESLSRDCTSLINSNDWDTPKNNLYTFDVAMKDNNITSNEQLLSRADAAEIVIAWFWRCFGSYNLIYNFTDDLNEYCNC